MPSIYLGAQSDSYCSGTTKVTVTEEPYTHCKLFKRFKHEFGEGGQQLNGQPIYVCKGEGPPTTNGESGTSCSNGGDTCKNGKGQKFEIKMEGQHATAKLQYVHVYFNQHDEKKTPLLFVLQFDKGENKYYKMSEFDRDLKSGSKSISELEGYYDEPGIRPTLINENDKTNDSLTYDLHEKDNGGGSRMTNYTDKISVTPKEEVNGGTKGKFYKHVHKPKDAPMVRKSFVLYNNNVLMKSIDKPLDEIQGKNYTSITVYFSKEGDKPLLIELEKSGGSTTYVKRVIGSSYKTLLWVIDARAALKFSTGDDTRLANHLEQIVISLDNKIYVLLDKQERYGKDKLNGLKGPGKTVELSKYQPTLITVTATDELKVMGDGGQPIQYKKYTHSITVEGKALEDVPQEVKSQAEFELIPSIPKVVIPMFEGSVGTGKLTHTL